MHLEFDGLRGGFSGGIADGEGIRSGFVGRKIEAAIVRGPDFPGRRVEGDGFGVGYVVAELRGLAAMNGGGGNVESADGEFAAAELLDGSAIVFAALLGGFFGVAALVLTIGIVAGEEKDGNVDNDGEEDYSGVEIRILEDGFLRGWLRVHAMDLSKGGNDRIREDNPVIQSEDLSSARVRFGGKRAGCRRGRRRRWRLRRVAASRRLR